LEVVEQAVDLVIQCLKFLVQMETHLHFQQLHQQVVVEVVVQVVLLEQLEDLVVEQIMMQVLDQVVLVMLGHLIHLKEMLEEAHLDQVQVVVEVQVVVALQLQVLLEEMLRLILNLVALEVLEHQMILMVVPQHTQRVVLVDQQALRQEHQVQLTLVMVELVEVDHIHLVV
tara:strand:+ start:260 stop:772 length:513 start_codon:yes stop_codon:yes gene_type:complete